MKKSIGWLSLALLMGCAGGKENYDATGTFETTEVVVSAEASGRLLRLSLEEGDSLEANRIVGLVDTVQLALKRDQLLANLKSVESQRPDLQKQIAGLKQRLSTALKEKQRVENLLKAGAANGKQLDDWEAQVALLEKEVAAQQSSLQNTVNSLSQQGLSVAIQIAQVEDQLNKCRLESPINGVVLSKYVEEGELVSFGKPLFKVGDMRRMILRAYLTSTQLASVKTGDRVTAYLDYGTDTPISYSGKITWISDRAEFTPKTILTKDERADQVYAVKIAVRNDGRIKIGMYGGVVFKPSKDE